MHTLSSASRTCMASASAVECTATVAMPSSFAARRMRSAISPRFAMRILSNMGAKGRDHSITRSGSPYSTGVPSSTKIAVTMPARGAAMSLKVFIASIRRSLSPISTREPTSTKFLASGDGLRYAVPTMGDGTVPGWLFAAASGAGTALPAAEDRVAGIIGGPDAAAAMGTITDALIERATRMRRSPFSTSISLRSVAARRLASSRTSSGSKGEFLAILELSWRLSGRRFPLAQDGDHGIEPERVAHRPEPADHAGADRGDHGFVPEGLARITVRDVHFYGDRAAAADRIPQGERGVRVGAGVDDDAGALETGLLDPPHELALVVGLAEGQLDGGFACPLAHAALDFIEGRRTIDRRLAPAEQVEVRTVEDVNRGHRGEALRSRPRKRRPAPS